jgi:hypothetical protein
VIDDYYLSYDPSFVLSKDENICVFLLDKMDGGYLREVLAAHPDLNTTLDGFTFFSNNISEFSNTFPSVTKMLTGRYSDTDDTREAYWAKAWSEPYFIDTLIADGYDSYLLPDKLSTYGSLEQLVGRTHNLRLPTTAQYTINHEVILATAYRLSLIRLLPYQSKALLARMNADFANNFFTWHLDDKLFPVIGNETDVNYFERLKEVRLSSENANKVFTFTHFNSAHDGGYQYDPTTNTMVAGGSYLDSAYASLAILAEYFRQMKALGVYDNSTIIILADHGATQQTIENMQYVGMKTSCLLIKPRDTRGDLIIDPVTPMSNAYLGASILEYAGLPHTELGISYNDIITGKQLVKTRYLFLNHNGEIYRYEVSGDANDYANWK